MWRAVRRVPEFLRASDEQMRRDQDLIRRKNLGTLKSVCLVYTLLLLAYAVTALFLFDSIPLRVLYGIFVAAQLAFDIWLLSVRTSPPAYRRVQACLLYTSHPRRHNFCSRSPYPFPSFHRLEAAAGACLLILSRSSNRCRPARDQSRWMRASLRGSDTGAT